jgi:hypothetical protein
MLSYLKSTEMAVSKPKGRPPKKVPAKAKPKGKLGLTTTRKCSLPITSKTDRASKVQKITSKANSGKRVNGRGASVTDVFDNSNDDDNEFIQPRDESKTDSLTPTRQVLRIGTPSSDDDLNPTSGYNNSLQNEIVRIKFAHSEELAQLQQQLSASQARVGQIKEDAEREAIEQQRRQSVASGKYMADLEDELEAERSRSSDLSWECDHLRRGLEAARGCLKGEAGLIQQRDEYERLYKEEHDTNADLMHKLTQKDEESTRKATEMAKEVQQLTTQTQNLRHELTQLTNENAVLRASSSLQYTERHSSASPVPSQSSTALSQSTTSNAEQRLANIRKTYITVKKRYDNIHSVAMNISTTTQIWDYGSLGEFGQYLRQLKTALEENGPEQQGTTMGSGSQAARVD